MQFIFWYCSFLFIERSSSLELPFSDFGTVNDTSFNDPQYVVIHSLPEQQNKEPVENVLPLDVQFINENRENRVKALDFVFLDSAERKLSNDVIKRDKHDKCCEWAGDNECHENPNWMWANCPQACTTAGCDNKSSTENIDLNDGFRDEHQLCCFWASEGHCRTNTVWMLPNCPASCRNEDCIEKGNEEKLEQTDVKEKESEEVISSPLKVEDLPVDDDDTFHFMISSPTERKRLPETVSTELIQPIQSKSRLHGLISGLSKNTNDEISHLLPFEPIHSPVQSHVATFKLNPEPLSLVQIPASVTPLPIASSLGSGSKMSILCCLWESMGGCGNPGTWMKAKCPNVCASDFCKRRRHGEHDSQTHQHQHGHPENHDQSVIHLHPENHDHPETHGVPKAKSNVSVQVL